MTHFPVSYVVNEKRRRSLTYTFCFTLPFTLRLAVKCDLYKNL